MDFVIDLQFTIESIILVVLTVLIVIMIKHSKETDELLKFVVEWCAEHDIRLDKLEKRKSD